MTPNLGMLHGDYEQQGQSVHLPNGSKVNISHIGQCRLPQGVIQNVLHVPDFKLNLLSVPKMTKELQCCMVFYPDFCLLQDLHTGKVRGTGKMEGGLYFWDHKEKTCVTSAASIGTQADHELWHRRLGHVPSRILEQMSLVDSKNTVLSSCPI